MKRLEKGAMRPVLAMSDFRQGMTIEDALRERWHVQRAHRAEEVLWRLRSGRYAALILALRPSDGYGLETLEEVLRAHPEAAVVVLVEPGAELQAARALSLGAAGYVPTGPTLPVFLEPVLEQALLSARLWKTQSQALHLESQDQLRALALSIRHELNNPLTGILGSAEMALKSPELPPSLARRFTNIVRLTEEIRALLQELETIPEKPSRLWQPT